MDTHADFSIKEVHEGRSYNVPKRLVSESLRLQALRDTLDHPNTRLFTVERRLAHQGAIVRIPVEAMNGAEAGVIADEVKYAMDWQNGSVSHHHAKPPENWAMNWPGIVKVV